MWSPFLRTVLTLWSPFLWLQISALVHSTAPWSIGLFYLLSLAVALALLRTTCNFIHFSISECQVLSPCSQPWSQWPWQYHLADHGGQQLLVSFLIRMFSSPTNLTVALSHEYLYTCLNLGLFLVTKIFLFLMWAETPTTVPWLSFFSPMGHPCSSFATPSSLLLSLSILLLIMCVFILLPFPSEANLCLFLLISWSFYLFLLPWSHFPQAPSSNDLSSLCWKLSKGSHSPLVSDTYLVLFWDPPKAHYHIV